MCTEFWFGDARRNLRKRGRMDVVKCDNKTYLRDTACVDGRWELGPVLSSGGNLMFM
jgi:hypothetical protein